jgi:uncharacterized protein YndB with AHSA1/START domain
MPYSAFSYLNGGQLIMTDNQTIHQKVTIQAPSTKVFQALTEPEILENWFPSQAKADLRQGGSYQYVFKFKDPQQGGTQEGQFLELRSGEKISYTWEAGCKKTQVVFCRRSKVRKRKWN